MRKVEAGSGVGVARTVAQRKRDVHGPPLCVTVSGAAGGLQHLRCRGPHASTSHCLFTGSHAVVPEERTRFQMRTRELT